MDIKGIATSLIREYRTRDPLALARAKGYLIIQTPLEGVRGFYQYIKRCHIIYLDSRLDEKETMFVCAHELGHSLLHRGCNHVFLSNRTNAPISRYEWEADRFAVDLLFDDYDLLEYLDKPVEGVARSLGISLRLATYRMESVQPILLPSVETC